jgi:hypothetical protein
MDSYDGTNLRDQFADDLSRWQMLFGPDDGSMQIFRDACHAIWGVVFDVPTKPLPTSAESLDKFQVIALSLIRRARSTFGLESATAAGLLSSQKRWLSYAHQATRNNTRVPHEQGIEAWPDGSASDYGNSSILECDQGDEKPNFDTSSLNHEWSFPLPVLLMAGAIFAIALLFLLGNLPYA